MPSPRISKQYEGDAMFLTMTVIEWINIFTEKRYFEILLNSLNYCQKNKDLRIFGFVFMTNHLHLMVATKIINLAEVIRDFKSYTTYEINKALLKDSRKYILRLLNNSFSKKPDKKNQIWQRENYPEIIRSYKFFGQKLEYIHYNPVRKGYVEKPEDWFYSSARYWYKGEDVGVKISDF